MAFSTTLRFPSLCRLPKNSSSSLPLISFSTSTSTSASVLFRSLPCKLNNAKRNLSIRSVSTEGNMCVLCFHYSYVCIHDFYLCVYWFRPCLIVPQIVNLSNLQVDNLRFLGLFVFGCENRNSCKYHNSNYLWRLKLSHLE